MRHLYVKLLLLVFTSMLFSCSENEPPATQQSFDVELSSTNIELETNKDLLISYQFIEPTDFSINVSVINSSESIVVDIDTDQQTISLQALDVLGSDTITLLFSSEGYELEKDINFTIVAADTSDDPNPGEEPNKTEVTESPYWITFPTDYITIFEEETIKISFRRNYTPNSDIIEYFYINSHNIDGIVDTEASTITIEALGGDEDTYGHISIVTEYQGVRNESSLQVLYLNKNRDLTTTEPPVIALLNPNINIEKSSYVVKSFDVYDPDSDRISYRVLSAPANVKTHVNKAQAGYELTINALDNIDPSDNILTLEVSDAHNTDVFDFNLISSAEPTGEVDNTPSDLFIEKNVILSPLIQFPNGEGEAIKTLAFAYLDSDKDRVEFEMQSSNPNYEFRLSPPFIEVSGADIDGLQHDQLTLVAEDGTYQSRLTFHFYIQDNYLEFYGGNPNTAPLIEVQPQASVLETKTISIPFQSTDFEQHDYEVTLEFDQQLISATLISENEIEVTATSPEQITQTQLIVHLEDVFESVRSQLIDIEIYKNTPPIIEYSAGDINMVEGTLVYKDITFVDPDQSEFIPRFEYDESLLEVSYRNEQVVVKALDVEEDKYSEIVVYITDEFGQQAVATIPLVVRFLDPNNAPPTINFSTAEFEVLPGGTGSGTVTIADPDFDPLSIVHVSTSEYLTYDYTQATGEIDFLVSADSPFNQDYQIVFTVSDGAHVVELPIDIRIATAPEAPILTLAKYPDTVEEESSFLVNFDIVDFNGDEIELSTIGLASDIRVEFYADYIEVFAPEDIFFDTTYQFTLLATDETGYTDSEVISFVATPVNDAPVIELSETVVTLVNDDVYALTYSIVDIDSGSHEVEIPIDDAISDRLTASVFPGINTIYLNGHEKGDVGNFILTVTVKDGEAYSEQDLEVYLTLDNAAPVIRFSGFEELVPWIEMSELSTRTINLSITDPDGDSRSSVNGDVLNISCSTTSNNLIIDTCSLSAIKISTLDVTDTETGVAVTITVTDGFENYPAPDTGQATVQFKVDIQAN